MEQGGMAISTMRFSEASRAERSCVQLLLFSPQILHLIPGAGAEIQHFSSRRVNAAMGWAGPDAGRVGAGFGAALGLHTEQEPWHGRFPWPWWMEHEGQCEPGTSLPAAGIQQGQGTRAPLGLVLQHKALPIAVTPCHGLAWQWSVEKTRKISCGV